MILAIFAMLGSTIAHGRSFVGIELNPEYSKLARARIKDDAPLFNKMAAP